MYKVYKIVVIFIIFCVFNFKFVYSKLWKVSLFNDFLVNTLDLIHVIQKIQIINTRRPNKWKEHKCVSGG